MSGVDLDEITHAGQIRTGQMDHPIMGSGNYPNLMLSKTGNLPYLAVFHVANLTERFAKPNKLGQFGSCMGTLMW